MNALEHVLRSPASELFALQLRADETGGSKALHDVLRGVRRTLLEDEETPKFLAGPFQAPAGPFLLLDLRGTSLRFRLSVQQRLERAALDQGIAEMNTTVIQDRGPFDEGLAVQVSDVVVLAAYPSFRRPLCLRDTALPESWLSGVVQDMASVGWLVKESLDCLFAGSVYASVLSEDLPSVLRSALLAKTDVLVKVPTSTSPALRTVGSHGLFLAAHLDGAGERSHTAVDALIDVARRLHDLGYAYVDITRDVNPLRTGHHHIPDNEIWFDYQQAEEFCDERIPDAFPWQHLTPGHLERLDKADHHVDLDRRATGPEYRPGDLATWWDERHSTRADPFGSPSRPHPERAQARQTLRPLLIDANDTRYTVTRLEERANVTGTN